MINDKDNIYNAKVEKGPFLTRGLFTKRALTNGLITDKNDKAMITNDKK